MALADSGQTKEGLLTTCGIIGMTELWICNDMCGMDEHSSPHVPKSSCTVEKVSDWTRRHSWEERGSEQLPRKVQRSICVSLEKHAGALQARNRGIRAEVDTQGFCSSADQVRSHLKSKLDS